WKKLQGEMHGLRTNNVMSKKLEDEKNFQIWAVTHDSAYPYAKTLLTYMQAEASAIDNTMREDMYIGNAAYGVELIQQASSLDAMLSLFRANLPENILRDTLKKIVSGLHEFYKNYDVPTDMQVFEALMPDFMDAGYAPRYYHNEYQHNDSNYHTWASLV